MGGFSFRIKGINLSARSRYRGFFYCSKNRKNLLLPRQQWKVGVVSIYHNNRKEPPFGPLDPPLQSHIFLCKEVDRSAYATLSTCVTP